MINGEALAGKLSPSASSSAIEPNLCHIQVLGILASKPKRKISHVARDQSLCSPEFRKRSAGSFGDEARRSLPCIPIIVGQIVEDDCAITGPGPACRIDATAIWLATPDDAPPIRPEPARSAPRDQLETKNPSESCNPIESPTASDFSAKRADTARSDIDPMVIGEDLTYSDLYAGLQAAEGVLNRPVNPNFLSIKDWRQKLSQKNSFVSKLSTQPKIFIFGGEMILNYEREGPR